MRRGEAIVARRRKRKERAQHQRSAKRKVAPDKSKLPIHQSDRSLELTPGLAEESAVPYAGSPTPAVPSSLRRPPLISAQLQLLGMLLSIAVEGVVVWSGGRALARTHGWDGAGRIAVAAILPAVVLIFVGGLAATGFTRARVLAQYARLKIIGWGLLLPFVILPRLWQWSGDYQTAAHVFFGAGVGVLVAFLAQIQMARAHASWLLRNGPNWWRWQYRATASLFAAVGGYLALQIW